MQNTTHTFEFTADEVRERTISEGHPQTLRFVNKTDRVEGKVPYCMLLKQKIFGVILDKQRTSFDGGLKRGATTTRAYLKCSHGVNNVVAFQNAELLLDRPLTWTLNVKCKTCSGQDASIPIAQSSGVTYSARNEVSTIFDEVVKKISDVLSQAHAICAATEEPTATLTENKQRFSEMLTDAWNKLVPDIQPQLPTRE